MKKEKKRKNLGLDLGGLGARRGKKKGLGKGMGSGGCYTGPVAGQGGREEQGGIREIGR